MDQGRRSFSARLALLGLVVCVVAAGCGGSSGSGDPSRLLTQTFSGAHKVNSGRLAFSVSIQPSSSAPLKNPLALSFSGPFQSRGTGQLPASNFDLSLNALGRSLSIGILSTGTSGYVSLQGTSYRLPTAEYQRLESSFASLASSPGASGGSGILGKLGIQPLTWLRNPQVLGTETVGGAATTHIRAAVNVPGFLHDFNTFLGHASSLGVSGAASFPHGLSSATVNQLATEIQNPRFDVWTGKDDKTIRKLVIDLTAPVPAQLASLIGSRAGLVVTMQYSDLNQPQTVTAPTSLAPYSQFSARIRSTLTGLLGSALSGATGSSGLGGGSSSGGGGNSSGGSGSGGSGIPNSYIQCINSAHNDISKMQQCASLLGGG